MGYRWSKNADGSWTKTFFRDRRPADKPRLALERAVQRAHCPHCGKSLPPVSGPSSSPDNEGQRRPRAYG